MQRGEVEQRASSYPVKVASSQLAPHCLTPTLYSVLRKP